MHSPYVSPWTAPKRDPPGLPGQVPDTPPSCPVSQFALYRQVPAGSCHFGHTAGHGRATGQLLAPMVPVACMPLWPPPAAGYTVNVTTAPAVAVAKVPWKKRSTPTALPVRSVAVP